MNHALKLRAALVAAAALAFPATAAADSIVYVDGGNVWSASPDGTRKVQLTDGGGWHSPTQADDGTIAAVQGTGPIVVMARDGRPLRTITTPPARSADGGTFAPRPVQLSFSPDGSKLAYAYLASSCPVASTCGSVQRSTFYTRADVTTATPVDVWGNQFSVSNPEWVTNDRALLSGGFGSQVVLDDLGGGDYSFTHWLAPNDDQGDPELSRDGRHLATTYSYGAGTVLKFFAVNGDARTQSPPPDPDLACTTTHPDERYGDPSWSPDGMGIAFESSQGVTVARFATLLAGECATTGTDVILSATSSSPDWGPADPPAARYTPDPQPGPAPAPAPKLKVKARAAKLRGKTATVTITCSASCKGTVTVYDGRKKAGRKAFSRAGRVTVKLKRSLKKAKLVVATPAGRITITARR